MSIRTISKLLRRDYTTTEQPSQPGVVFRTCTPPDCWLESRHKVGETLIAADVKIRKDKSFAFSPTQRGFDYYY